MVKLAGLFSRLGQAKVLVIGDLVLDTYTIGKARRISPEAPVAVVNVCRQENLPGGAGNVVLNLVSLGSEVVAIGRIGQDAAGQTLKNALSNEGVNTEGIIVQAGFPTPVKNRIIAGNQQIVRIDHEEIMPLSEDLESAIIDALPALLAGVQVVAISDYGKGFLTRTLLSAIIEISRQKNILIISDPKGIEFSKYVGAHVIKPNLGEAYAAANAPLDAPLALVADRLLKVTEAETLMITRSEEGISLFHRDGSREDFPVKAREVKDVTGAGDTVLAMLAYALANELPMSVAVQLSNVAAGIAIEHVGCARVSSAELARRLLEEDVGNKIFERDHLLALQQATRGKKTAVLSLSASQGFTSSIFTTIQDLSQRGQRDLLVHILEEQPEAQFINLLASLKEVNFILLKADGVKQICQLIQPEAVCIIDRDQKVRFTTIEDFLTVAHE